jgi:hypothetical protein
MIRSGKFKVEPEIEDSDTVDADLKNDDSDIED